MIRSMSDALRALDTGLIKAKRKAYHTLRKPLRGRMAARREALDGVTFIGVTGSCGKTTTKELLAAALATAGSVKRSRGSNNTISSLVDLIARTEPTDRFAVMEVAAWGPGTMDDSLRLLRPRVGVVTNIGSDHWARYGSLDGIAAEKGKLVRCLPADGLAVLNADDRRVLGMRSLWPGRIVTYGVEQDADFRAAHVASAWPERLSFQLLYRGERYPVRTRLCGTHWAPDILAALAAATELGASLPDAIRAIEAVEPMRQRMRPEVHADGVTFIHDDNKAPLWSVGLALRFLREARATRRVAVIGTISDRRKLSDQKGKDDRVYRDVASEALDSADHVVFVGELARHALRARHPRAQTALRAFATIREAADHLSGYLRAGDLVLLKGSHRMDHLMRIPLSRVRHVRCWRGYCARQKSCDQCLFVRVPF
jgi:UDP-N-acetylmuramyl pentapeptide synthase